MKAINSVNKTVDSIQKKIEEIKEEVEGIEKVSGNVAVCRARNNSQTYCTVWAIFQTKLSNLINF